MTGSNLTGFGLCATCRWQRVIRSGRGSTFSLCERSREDPRYPKYPRLPVPACAGYEPGVEEGALPPSEG